MITRIPKEQHDNDTQLYRYLSIPALFMLLQKKSVFIPSINLLAQNDPFEGVPASTYRELGATLNAQEYASISEWLGDNAEDSEKKWLEDSSSQAHTLATLYVKQLCVRRAAWCWFRANIESSLMWATYGHKGAAIVSSTHQLRESLPRNINFQIADVQYVDTRGGSSRQFNPRSKENAEYKLRPHLLKRIEYQDEQELRVVCECRPGERGAIVTGIRPGKLISKVILSPLLPESEAESLKCQIEKFGREKFKVEKSRLIKDDFLFGMRTILNKLSDAQYQVDRKTIPISFRRI